MTEKLLDSLPFCCSTHSAATACEACESAHRVRWQDGATGLCQSLTLQQTARELLLPLPQPLQI
jgi:hypothetical protein